MSEVTKVTKNPVRAKVVGVSKDHSTAKVEVPTVVKNALYGKRLHRVISLHVDTAGQALKVGGFVDILPSRRMSKTKSWKVISVIS